MKKKEFAVGEVFQFGLKKLKVVADGSEKDGLGCGLCDLYEIHCELLSDIVGDCDCSLRSDGENVHFVEVEDEE